MTRKTDKPYWNALQEGKPIPPAFNPQDIELANHINQQTHAFLRGVFSEIETSGLKLLEIGCAASIWLPYFSKEYGFDVTGIDYSETGCERARTILKRTKAQGNVHVGDFLDPPPGFSRNFDVVISFGVMEHFDPIEGAVLAASHLLAPDGLLITLTPNLTGVTGRFQKFINRPVYDRHQVASARELAAIHTDSGLVVKDCAYFGSLNFGVCNLNGIERGSTAWIFKKCIISGLAHLSKIAWLTDRLTDRPPENRIISSYIACTARKPNR